MNWPDLVRKEPIEYVWPPFQGESFQVTKQELAHLRNLGFDFIRLTLDPGIFMSVTADRRSELMDILKNNIDLFHSSGLTLVLDPHPTTQNEQFRPEKILAGSDSEAFRAYSKLIASLAALLDGFPHDRVALELYNEPQMSDDAGILRWQSLAESLHASARDSAPSLPLVIIGASWGTIRGFLRLDPRPFKGSNAFYTFHYYNPHPFTHQTVENAYARYISDLPWPPRDNSLERTLARAVSAIDGDRTLGDAVREKTLAATKRVIMDYYKENPGPSSVYEDFNKVARWATTYSIPTSRILLGEFGAVRQPPGPDKMFAEDRLRWLRTVRRRAEDFGFPWAFWHYKGYGGMTLVEDKTIVSDTPPRALEAGVVSALGMTS